MTRSAGTGDLQGRRRGKIGFASGGGLPGVEGGRGAAVCSSRLVRSVLSKAGCARLVKQFEYSGQGCVTMATQGRPRFPIAFANQKYYGYPRSRGWQRGGGDLCVPSLGLCPAT